MISIKVPESISDPKDRERYYQREWRKIYRKQFPEKDRAACLRYNISHRDKRNGYARTEVAKSQVARYYRSHREEILKRASRYRKLHPRKPRKEYCLNWQRKNRSKCALYARRRRARRALCYVDFTADQFYSYVRSRKKIRCYYCSEWVSGKKAHVDHVIAVARQGNHASSNLCASCPKCNASKRDLLPSQTSFNKQPLLDL